MRVCVSLSLSLSVSVMRKPSSHRPQYQSHLNNCHTPPSRAPPHCCLSLSILLLRLPRIRLHRAARPPPPARLPGLIGPYATAPTLSSLIISPLPARPALRRRCLVPVSRDLSASQLLPRLYLRSCSPPIHPPLRPWDARRLLSHPVCTTDTFTPHLRGPPGHPATTPWPQHHYYHFHHGRRERPSSGAKRLSNTKVDQDRRANAARLFAGVSFAQTRTLPITARGAAPRVALQPRQHQPSASRHPGPGDRIDQTSQQRSEVQKPFQ